MASPKTNCPQGHKLSYLANQKRYRCRTCDASRHSEYYYANREMINGKRKYTNMRDRYGVTKHVYDTLLSSQNNRCAICHEASKKALSIDHCHQTKIIRGLLCQRCNFLLGLARDNKTILQNAVSYLK